MNTRELLGVVQKEPKLNGTFVGVFPADKLPVLATRRRRNGRKRRREAEKKTVSLIANVDGHREIGSHWIAIYIDSRGRGEFFDSYGRHPTLCSPYFTKFLNANADVWTYNRKSLQSSWSTVCGQYCLYYLIRRARGDSMSSILSEFNSRTRGQNDQRVYHYINNYLHSPPPLVDANFLYNQIAKSWMLK